jgi:hypothetical protein
MSAAMEKKSTAGMTTKKKKKTTKDVLMHTIQKHEITPRDHESQWETELEVFTTLLRHKERTGLLAVEAAKEETDRGGKGHERVPKIFKTLLKQAKAKECRSELQAIKMVLEAVLQWRRRRNDG